MRIQLFKLHSDPKIFKPIEFSDGINLVMGEKVKVDNVKRGKKTNGVGKSLCVEFINFCLLKKTKDSRVMKIPLDKFSEDTQIILDLEINGQGLRITRTKEKPENPMITKDGKETEFSNLDDANQYLRKLLFPELSDNINLSFREFLGPFVREEASEFKDIMSCYDLTRRIPPAIKPHAFIFDLDVSIIASIQKSFREIEKINGHKLKLKKFLTENGTKKISDVKATLNSLNNDLKKIDLALKSFKTNDAYETQQEDLTKIQLKIDGLRFRQSALRYQLKKIKSFPSLEVIKKKEIEIVYNQFKNGLGDVVTKSIEEVISFKQKIDEFQKGLFNERIISLSDELKVTTKSLQVFEDNRLEKLKIIDQKGILKDIKNGYAIYLQKKDARSKTKGEKPSGLLFLLFSATKGFLLNRRKLVGFALTVLMSILWGACNVSLRFLAINNVDVFFTSSVMLITGALSCFFLSYFFKSFAPSNTKNIKIDLDIDDFCLLVIGNSVNFLAFIYAVYFVSSSQVIILNKVNP
ncbi:MAG: hypothetical protein HQ541_18485, partial [Mariniphaga sp.]|nr:hypothetical protein [Mariniphaga sp.]